MVTAKPFRKGSAVGLAHVHSELGRAHVRFPRQHRTRTGQFVQVIHRPWVIGSWAGRRTWSTTTPFLAYIADSFLSADAKRRNGSKSPGPNTASPWKPFSGNFMLIVYAKPYHLSSLVDHIESSGAQGYAVIFRPETVGDLARVHPRNRCTRLARRRIAFGLDTVRVNGSS
jgi:hypothetical protein